MVLWFLAVGCAAILLHRLRALTAGGALAAAVIGVVLGLRVGGWWLGWVTLLFGIGVAASRFKARHKAAAKSNHGRDAADLVPVGSALVTGALLPADQPLGRLLVLTAMSFALADILASELGPLFGGRAVSLPFLRPVPHGTPGAVSGAGVLAGLAGGALAAAPALAVGGARAVFAVCLAGQTGGLVDTVCGRLLPRRLPRRNDVVNAAGTWSAVLVCVALRDWIARST